MNQYKKTFILQPGYLPNNQNILQMTNQNRSLPTYISSGINIDTNEIFNNVNELDRQMKSSPAIMRNIQSRIDAQKLKEEEYINSNNVCPVSKLTNLRDHINTIDPEKFKNLIHDKFYDPAIMKEAICISNSLFFDGTGSVETNDRIRNWITSLKQIGEASIEGYAMSGSLKNTNLHSTYKGSHMIANDLFVIKAPQNPNDDNLLHELFIGIQLNKLRKFIPNFALVYGGFKCTSPVINTNKEVVSWCLQSDSPVNFVVYENIDPSIPMSEYVKDCTTTQFLDKYFQVLFSLRLAHSQLDYTHYDLHSQNVLIRDIKNKEYNKSDVDKFSIPYITNNNKIEYLITDKISTFIDNEFSHVEIDNIHYGFYKSLIYGVSPEKSFIIYDAYKLLLWCLYDMRSNNNIIYKDLESIFRYFNKIDDLEYVLDNQVNLSFPLTYTNVTKNIIFDDYIKYIRDIYPVTKQIIVQEKPHGRILGCSGTDVCMNDDDKTIETLLGLDQPLQVKTVFHFYDLVSTLVAEGRDNDIDGVMDRFDSNNAINNAFTKYDLLINVLAEKISKLLPININGVRVNTLLLNSQLYKSHMEYIINAIEIWDLAHQLYLIVDSIKYVLQWYDITNNNARYESLEENINSYLYPMVANFEDTLNTFQDGYLHTQKLLNENSELINQEIEKSNVIAIWYWKTFPIYHNIIYNTNIDVVSDVYIKNNRAKTI